MLPPFYGLSWNKKTEHVESSSLAASYMQVREYYNNYMVKIGEVKKYPKTPYGFPAAGKYVQ